MRKGYNAQPGTVSAAQARGCHGKVGLPSKRVAVARARALFAKGEAYKCPLCHRWHITSRRSARTTRADRIA